MNLIFDGNFILHKNVQILHKMNRLYGDFHTMMHNNINKYINANSWDKIIFVSDSKKKSWRQTDVDDQYKEHRVKNVDIDWKWVYTEYNQFKEDISTDYIVVEKDHIEGDDWITAILLKANKIGESNVVISSDKDLNQLVKYNLGNKRFINVQIDDKSNRERIYIPEGWELWLNDQDNRTDDIFNLSNVHHDVEWFKKTIHNFEYIEVNRYESLFKKLIMGDKGDNVPCPYKTLTSTGKERGIGESGANKIWKHYSENYEPYFDTEDNKFINEIVESIASVNSVNLDSRSKQISNQLKDNLSLMELHYRHYPDWVLNTIITELKDKQVF